MTKKSFNFAAKRNLPFYFVSASEGTNVVKVFNEAISMGYKYQQNPDRSVPPLALVRSSSPTPSPLLPLVLRCRIAPVGMISFDDREGRRQSGEWNTGLE